MLISTITGCGPAASASRSGAVLAGAVRGSGGTGDRRAMDGRVAGIVLALGLAVATGAARASAGPVTERISVGPEGSQANGQSFNPAISADGRLVAFDSDATDLVPGDTNSSVDIFVRDRTTGETRRVSVGLGGTQADGTSGFFFPPVISANGRLVAFTSDATNLVQGDSNRQTDVFVHDLVTGATRRGSVGRGGVQADGNSYQPAISADGRFLAFTSEADNLVRGDANGTVDVFVRDLEAGTIRLASRRSDGTIGNGSSSSPAVSADGRFVAYVSQATNLVPGDTNGRADVFVRDLVRSETRRASVGRGGAQSFGTSSDPTISADGRFVAFASKAKNLVQGDTNGKTDVFVRDLEAGTNRLASRGPSNALGNGDSVAPAISADGRSVAFASAATNLVPGDTNGRFDVFVRDLAAGETRRESVGTGGAQADDGSFQPAISADGSDVAFRSDATNLVPGDTNGAVDVFVRTR